MIYDVAADTVYTNSLDTLLTVPFSEYSRTEFFLLLIVVILISVIFLKMWRGR